MPRALNSTRRLADTTAESETGVKRGCGDLQERPAPACLIRPLVEGVILKPGAVQPGAASPIDRRMYAREMTDRKEFKLSHHPTVGRIGDSSLRFCLGFCLATLG